jgi:ubiquinone/menaquinone biosynthesis C-methylase UbiE
MPSQSLQKTRQFFRQVCPPIFLSWLGLLVKHIRNNRGNTKQTIRQGKEQDLDVYWDPQMAQMLETWGERNVWKELPLLMVNCHGKVLDIACGTGKTMEIIARFPLEVHGCDISNLLIGKAIERGIAKDRLMVVDATNMLYETASFDYAYSIGSLEHFTEEGILKFLSECHRVVRNVSFHQIPVSRNDKNQGWIKTYQSYHNNSVAWWMEKFTSVFGVVYALDSTWEDEISVGKWFVCIKDKSNLNS